jgi:site-specific DNA-methyltransferase (adenine-specific)
MTDLNTSTEATITTETAIGFIPCYRLPFLSLFHADCMEIMKQYPDKYFDLAIVDPPYGIGADKEKFTPINSTWNGKKKVGYTSKNWDKEIPTNQYFEELFRVSKKQIVWGGNYFGLAGGYIFWDKKETMPTYTKGELAWCSFMNKVDYFDFLWSGYKKQVQEIRVHPTQKPEYLYAFCLKNYATEGMKLLDTHFGSGSIALAVDKANRLDKMNLHLTACEIDKEYIDKAIKRISESIKQGTLSF